MNFFNLLLSLFIFLNLSSCFTSRQEIKSSSSESYTGAQDNQVTKEHCQLFPTSEVCSASEPEAPTTPSLQTQCEGITHEYGEVNLQTGCVKDEKIPITFVFINSSSRKLSTDIQLDSTVAIDALNSAFYHQGNQFIEFTLSKSIEIVDDAFYNSSCSLLGAAARKFGQKNALVMIFVNDLSGSCAGVSWMWAFPSNSISATMVEYRYPFIRGDFTPVVHEFAHMMGLNHTGNAFEGSVPKTGIKTFNEWLKFGSLSEKRCSQEFVYYIDPEKESTASQVKGVSWNSYQNTMYPSFGSKPDNGFFTSGYDYSVSWAFDCWYHIATSES